MFNNPDPASPPVAEMFKGGLRSHTHVGCSDSLFKEKKKRRPVFILRERERVQEKEKWSRNRERRFCTDCREEEKRGNFSNYQ